MNMLNCALEGLRMPGVVLDREGAVVFCNRSLLDMTGWCADEIAGRCWFETFVPEVNRARLKSEYLESMSVGTRSSRYGSVILSRSGMEIGMVWNCAVLRDSGGNPSGVAKIGFGNAEKTCPCDEIRRLRKYERIGRSAAELLHDLNNLHQVILGNTQTMLEGIPVSSSSNEYAEELRAMVKKGKMLSARTLSVIRGEERSEMAELDIVEVVMDFLNFLQCMLGRNITLKTELGECDGRIHGDREQIERLLMNLSTNARDAMPEGGEIRIGLSEAVFMKPVSCHRSEIAPGRYLCLSFSDNGHGMDKDVLEQIFEPFFTTREKGSGIGLASVMDIVREHGAHIDVSSTPGAGTTFRIYFPKRAADMDAGVTGNRD